MLSSKRDETLYRYVYETIMGEALRLYDFTDVHEHTINDNDAAIFNTFEYHLPYATRANCFFHMIKNLKKNHYKNLLTDPSLHHIIIQELKVIATTLPTDDDVEFAMEIFFLKYAGEVAFIGLFRREWWSGDKKTGAAVYWAREYLVPTTL